jgi:hypothetical protein
VAIASQLILRGMRPTHAQVTLLNARFTKKVETVAWNPFPVDIKCDTSMLSAPRASVSLITNRTSVAAPLMDAVEQVR